jgi:hypothetical protein
MPLSMTQLSNYEMPFFASVAMVHLLQYLFSG